MCFSSKIENTRKNCKFMFEQPCQCPPNQLEAIKFSKVISVRKGGGQACCLIMCGIFGFMPFILIVSSIIVSCCVIVCCCAAAVGGGHSSLEVLYRCSPCGKDTHRTYECVIEVDYFGGSRRYDQLSYDGDIRQRTRHRTRTYSAWGQYTEKVEKCELQQGRMTMKNFAAVERKFDLMSVIEDNYYKTTDEWTDTFIRHLE
ncbi:hypothetical protein niasHS_006153 [Heterodera schachtii]|uniref:Uncharacterized protein n=1 Tax=Heterodera schachtii TaxID=97005 RepID=A0ABD2JWA6_HETSC